MFAVTRMAQNFADFLCDIASAAHHADEETTASMTLERAHEVIAEFDARENRRGKPSLELREARAVIAGDSSFTNYNASQTKRYAVITDDEAATARSLANAILAHDRIVSRFARLAHLSDEATIATATAKHEAAALKLYGELKRIAPADFEIWNEARTAHLTGEAAATRNNDGTHHTDSCLGNATTIRYDATASLGSPNKSYCAGFMPEVEIDEAGAAALADMEAEGF